MTLSESDASYLAELLASADTPEDLQAVEQLLAEQEALRERANRWVCRTLSEVAQFFGMALQTVKQWRTETVPMPGDEGYYDLSEIVKWKLDKLSGLTARNAKHMQDLERGRVKLEAERLELARLRASMVHRDEVEEWAEIALTEARNLFLQIPGVVAAVCSLSEKDEVQEQVEAMIRETLHTLHDRLNAYAEAPGNPSNTTTAEGVEVSADGSIRRSGDCAA